MTPRLSTLILLLVGLFLAGREWLVLTRARADYHEWKGLRYEQHFQPGLIATVDWLAQQKAKDVVSVDIPEGSELQQRLAEMLYPSSFRIVSIDAIQPGEWVVTSDQAWLAQRCDLLAHYGELGVGRIRSTEPAP